MGKVKIVLHGLLHEVLQVSIPYGKGKDKALYPTLAETWRVSIPYGKGKVIGNRCYKNLGDRINSLWER